MSRPVGGDKSKKYDYAAAFNLFDEDGKGTISPDEFQHMLLRLQIISQTAERCGGGGDGLLLIRIYVAI